MNDPSDPLFGSGLQRQPVVCAMCGTAWDERVVSAPGTEDLELSLCPSCLLTTSHGDPFPDDPQPSASESGPVGTDA